MASQTSSPESDPIPAEVSAQPRREREAARVLQRLGFRVLHIGRTISVEAPESLWTSIFGFSFLDERVRQMDETGEITFKRPVEQQVQLPVELEGLVREVSFQQPPHLMH
jgi:hypothetical protein